MNKTTAPNKNEFYNFYQNHTGRETALHFAIAFSTVSKYARKFNIPRRSFKYKEIQNYLSGRQLEIINGSLLGDGCLEKLKTTNSNSRFIEKHGIQQEKYLEWKLNELTPFAESVRFGEEIKNGKLKKFCVMKTYSCPLFSELESKWYRNRIKCIPDDLSLTPLTLAIWFLDDGCNINQGEGLSIYTNGFSYSEVEKLVGKLKKIGITNCHKQNGSLKRGLKPVIYIGKSSVNDFIKIITPHVYVDCMKYKLERCI